ncbi:MAG: GntR family transcriptional regulator [Alphaproteobacteria bacterium]
MASRRTPSSAAKAPAPSLTEQAYRALEELIVTLELAPGSAISESDLCERTGFGRTPVREALQRLAQQRLVVILPRRGMLVAPIDVAGQLQLLDLRREIERLMARLAARRRDAGEAARFEKLAAGMERAADRDDDRVFLRLDRDFNELLDAACRNDFAGASMRQWNPLSRRFWYQHYRRAGDMPETARRHAAVARAIAAGDEAGASSSSDALIDHLAGFTRATLDADG